MGLLDRIGFAKLRDGLTKTRTQLVEKVSRVIAGRRTVDADVLQQLEEALIGADVGLDAATDIVNGISRRVRQEGVVDTGELDSLLREEVRRQLMPDGNRHTETNSSVTPHVIMMIGINGVGKTTTIGKLAHRYRSEGKKVLIAAADTFRAAANEQLEIWAERAGAEIIRQRPGADPAAVAFDALQSAIARNVDVVIIDTAGRLHTKVNLMEELKKIKRVLQKLSHDAPHDVLLVVDASTGQNGLQQARQFSAAVGVTGIVLTKLDGTAKGGIVIAIARELKIPVKYVGLGERLDDLQVFDSQAFVEALFGQVP